MGKSKTHTRKRRVRRKTRRGRGKKKVTFAPMRPSLFSQNIPLVRKRNLSKTYYTGQPDLRPHSRNASNTMYKWWLDEWDEFLENEGVGKKYEGGFRRRKKTRRRRRQGRRRGRQHF